MACVMYVLTFVKRSLFSSAAGINKWCGTASLKELRKFGGTVQWGVSNFWHFFFSFVLLFRCICLITLSRFFIFFFLFFHSILAFIYYSMHSSCHLLGADALMITQYDLVDLKMVSAQINQNILFPFIIRVSSMHSQANKQKEKENNIGKKPE